MAHRKKTESLPIKRLQAQTRAIHSLNKVLFAAVGLAAGCVVVATWFPQQRKLAELQQKLRETEEQERLVLAEKEYRETELRAMRDSNEFIELKALDRLPWHHPGEKIFRIQR